MGGQAEQFRDLVTADGAKLALWKLFRAGYKIVNFLHDEAIIEVPEDSDLAGHAARIEKLMIAGMKLVVPNVKITVSHAAMDHWYKDAEAVYEDGKLQVWQPEEETAARESSVSGRCFQ